MKTCKDIFNSYIDSIAKYKEFQPREISSIVTSVTGNRFPYSGTITRYIRERRKLYHDIELVNKAKSIYRKI